MDIKDYSFNPRAPEKCWLFHEPQWSLLELGRENAPFSSSHRLPLERSQTKMN